MLHDSDTSSQDAGIAHSADLLPPAPPTSGEVTSRRAVPWAERPDVVPAAGMAGRFRPRWPDVVLIASLRGRAGRPLRGAAGA